MKKSIKYLLYLLVIPFFGFAQTDTVKRFLPEGYDNQLDLTYKKVGVWEGKMDLFLPKNAAKPSAIIIFVHGGGWIGGSRGTANQFKTFFKKGYAVANIDYRLADVAPAPAAVEDVRTAICFLLKNSKKYNIDESKVVLMGGSAGGHLVLLAGYLENDKKFDTDCDYKKPIKIAAVIDKFGIANVWDYLHTKNGQSKTVWMGKNNNEAFADQLSPIKYVKKTTPPTLIVHGTADPSVNYEQSVKLNEVLLKNGVKSKFITVQDGKHGGFPANKNVEINLEILDFLNNLGITN